MGRREFLRRVALMSGGAALALPVLQTLGVAAAAEEIAQAASGPVAQTAQTPGVTVPPVDLASPIGGTARFSDLAQVTTYLGQTPPEQHVAVLNAGVRYLQEQSGVRRDRIGTMGYCFGGGMVWRLAAANADLRAAAPYYGANPPLADVPKIKAAVLAIYGEHDPRINAGIPEIREAMQRAGVVHEIVIFPGAGHAFFNDTGGAYRVDAAQGAWRRTLVWFERYLKGA